MPTQPEAKTLGDDTEKRNEIEQSTAKVESEIVQQRRLHRKKLKRYESDDESSVEDSKSDACADPSLEIKNDAPVKTVSVETESKRNVESNENDVDISNKSKDERNKESKKESTIDTKKNDHNSAKVEVDKEEKTSATAKPVNATDIISEVANQNLTGELSLLQTYEKKGVMNEVFGSQSVLSQELITTNGLSQQSQPHSFKLPTSPESQFNNSLGLPSFTAFANRKKKPMKFDHDDDDDDDDDDDNTAEDNNTTEDNNTEESNLPSSNTSSSIAASKLAAQNETFSQSSFVVNSLPPLSVPESQFVQDTMPMNAPLSQASTLSGYDMIIGAAQALAERDGENPPFEEQEDESKANDDNEEPPVPPLPKPESSMKTVIEELKSKKESLRKHESPKKKVGKGTLSPPLSPGASSNDESKKRARSDQTTNELESPKKMPCLNNASSPKSSSSSSPPPASGQAAGTGYIQTNGTTYAVRRTKAQRKKIEEETNYIAKRAAELVEQLRVNRKVEKQLLLSMALTRENPRSGPSQFPPSGTTILNGFYWGQFPPLEKVLRSYMEEYYELSIEKCQSRTQQAFNNKLVTLVTNEAKSYGWAFDPGSFDEKKVRDRIRCFFKTHIQNAKKRLKTMVRNPLKRANAKALASHLDLIEKCDLIDKIHETSEGAPPPEGGEQVAKDDGKMPSLSTTTTNTNNSRSIYDSDAHDAAQVVSNLTIF
jgi:hypothetical protein